MRAGAWLFKRRSALPLPMAAALLLIKPAQQVPTTLTVAGVVLVALGESIRLWAVRYIGAISRTRSDRLGPLVSAGPFALVRNPLYLANIAIWFGFALSAGPLWMAPIVLVVLASEYHAIVRWEEQLLEARRGEEYRAYAARVPRWNPFSTNSAPSASSASSATSANPFSFRDAIFSERGTLIAIAVGYVLLYLKLRS